MCHLWLLEIHPLPHVYQGQRTVSVGMLCGIICTRIIPPQYIMQEKTWNLLTYSELLQFKNICLLKSYVIKIAQLSKESAQGTCVILLSMTLTDVTLNSIKCCISEIVLSSVKVTFELKKHSCRCEQNEPWFASVMHQ